MPVTSCRLDYETDTADFDGRNLGTYQLRWLIDTDEPMAPGAAANQATEVGPNMLPELWSTYEHLGHTDDTSYLRSLAIKRHRDSRLKFIADGTYTPAQPGEVFNAGFGGPDPLERPPVWSGSGEVFTELVDFDAGGNPIVNSAGDLFDPTIEREAIHSVAIAVKNYGTLTEVFNLMETMSGAVNVASWQGRAARTVLCREARPLPHVTEGLHSYIPVEFYFVLAQKGSTWDNRVLNQGFRYLETNPAGGDPIVTEVTGSTPVNLSDGSPGLPPAGHKLPQGQVGNHLTFRTRREVNFLNELGF